MVVSLFAMGSPDCIPDASGDRILTTQQTVWAWHALLLAMINLYEKLVNRLPAALTCDISKEKCTPSRVVGNVHASCCSVQKEKEIPHFGQPTGVITCVKILSNFETNKNRVEKADMMPAAQTEYQP